MLKTFRNLPRQSNSTFIFTALHVSGKVVRHSLT